MSFCPDTSFLFSLYIADANTPTALLVRQTQSTPLPITAFHRVELRNAVCLAVFRKQITQTIAYAAWRNLEADLQNGSLVYESVIWADVFLEAEKLVLQHTATAGSRSLDVIHVAAAKILSASDFITFDARQAKMAAKAGFHVSPIPVAN